jgi:hypothetical protein
VIIGAAVCPGAPFLVEGVAPAVAARMTEVGTACARSVAQLPRADAVLLVTAGARSGRSGWRVFAPGAVISPASIVRSDLAGTRVPADRPVTDGESGPAPELIDDPAVGTIVGAHLLALDRPGTPVVAVEVHDDPTGAAAAAAGAVAGFDRIALLVIADGSACHGDDAPGRRDDRSAPFDATLATALAAGDPAALTRACADRALAADLLANVDPLEVLARLTADRCPVAAELLFAGAPLGVGYLVASWHWSGG